MVANNWAKVALLPWGDVFEDFLEPIGVSLEKFCNEMTGGWLFGYVEALELVGVRTAIIIFSTQVTSITRRTHLPTGASIIILPATKSFRVIRRIAPYLHFGDTVSPYLSMPLTPLVQELRREGCDSILCQEYEYGRFDVCLLVGRLTGLPVFASFQGGVKRRDSLGRFIRSRLLRASRGLIIAPSCEAQRVHRQYHLSHHKVAQIFNPLDLQKWPILDRDRVRAEFSIPLNAEIVVWHGRISMQHKGLDILLDVWEQICRERPERDLRLLLLGTGQDADEFSRCLAMKRLPGVRWVNRYLHDRAEMQRYLLTGNVYVFSSRYEGFPVAPLEAMACGLPVVATDVQGIADIFKGGEESGGIVVPLEDAAKLALALGRVLDDKPYARELGRRARRRVETSFSLETVGQQLRSFLLNGK
jgi:starch synthase